MSLFLDTARIEVKAGKGGDGAVAFRREKYVPDGGPAGGDGGKGGSVIFKVDEGMSTLMDFRYNRIFRGKPGEKGMNKGMHGRGAEDLIVHVPQGTTVKDNETGDVLVDLIEKDQEFAVAKGGRGGRGNIRFATPRNPAPEVAENGEPGEDKILLLELRVLADVGLVGFPSVGKSTLLSVVSNARPKIGAYHFTTITPNIGMVQVGYGDSFVMADMPGLIEGAHSGAGLGIQFLRHIERTSVILHMIDAMTEDVVESYRVIRRELAQHSTALVTKPEVIALTKIDAVSESTVKQQLEHLRQVTKSPIYPISAPAHLGILGLLRHLAEMVEQQKAKQAPIDQADASSRVEIKLDSWQLATSWWVSRKDDGSYLVTGEKIERFAERTDFASEFSINRLRDILAKLNIVAELIKQGATGESVIEIAGHRFPLQEQWDDVS